MSAASWVNSILIPPTAVVILLWLFNLQARRFARAWRLTYTVQGLAVLAAAGCLACGDWPDAAAAAFLALASAGSRRVFTSDGLHARWLP